MTGWYIAGGIAMWGAMAFVVTLFIGGSAHLRDDRRPAAPTPPWRPLRSSTKRPACCSKDAEGPLHHPAICVASPCCFRCPQADPRRAL